MVLQNLKRWISKRENILVELLGVICWVLMAIGALYLYLSSRLDLLTLLQVFLGLLLTGLPIYFYLVKKREQILLLGFTSKYLLEKDESKIDDLLSILIAGKWEKLRVDPIEEFYTAIKGLCLRGNAEMRRRIAEALPALFKLDMEETKKLAEILRHDWDSEQFKSDNRRRTIEAMPYIMKKERSFVKNILRLVDKDEIYTIIAIVEVLDAWRVKVNENEATKLIANLVYEMRKKEHGDNEIAAMRKFWDLLELTRSSIGLAAKRFEELKDTSNVYLQICIARNLRRLCENYPRCREKHICNGSPDKILDLTAFFIQENIHKNVRRPIAKEDSIECLIILLVYNNYAKKARDIIWALMNDKDDIIRLSVFDRIESIITVDAIFGRTILQHVIADNYSPKLVERARALNSRLSEESKL